MRNSHKKRKKKKKNGFNGKRVSTAEIIFSKQHLNVMSEGIGGGGKERIEKAQNYAKAMKKKKIGEGGGSGERLADVK